MDFSNNSAPVFCAESCEMARANRGQSFIVTAGHFIIDYTETTGMPFDQPFPSLPSALTVLTSMITPALLISATGTFILSTSNRLGRVVDRVRAIADLLDDLMHGKAGIELVEERKAMLVGQL